MNQFELIKYIWDGLVSLRANKQDGIKNLRITIHNFIASYASLTSFAIKLGVRNRLIVRPDP